MCEVSDYEAVLGQKNTIILHAIEYAIKSFNKNSDISF